MLELAIRPSDPKAAEIVTKHVNSQLLQVMREKIYEYPMTIMLTTTELWLFDSCLPVHRFR